MAVSYLSLTKCWMPSKSKGARIMKMARMRVFVTATAIAVVFFSLSAQAQSASETLYKGKCAACHGVDGAGSAMGTKMGVHDFSTAAVQGMSDAELTDIITNGKNK